MTKPRLENKVCSTIFLYLERRTEWFLPFAMVLTRNETQTATSEIWTLVADSISYDDNHYTKRTTKCNHKCVCVCVNRNQFRLLIFIFQFEVCLCTLFTDEIQSFFDERKSSKIFNQKLKCHRVMINVNKLIPLLLFPSELKSNRLWKRTWQIQSVCKECTMQYKKKVYF